MEIETINIIKKYILNDKSNILEKEILKYFGNNKLEFLRSYSYIITNGIERKLYYGLLDKCKLFNKITEEELNEYVLNSRYFNMEDLLEIFRKKDKKVFHKKFIIKYKNCLKNYLLENSQIYLELYAHYKSRNTITIGYLDELEIDLENQISKYLKSNIDINLIHKFKEMNISKIIKEKIECKIKELLSLDEKNLMKKLYLLNYETDVDCKFKFSNIDNIQIDKDKFELQFPANKVLNARGKLALFENFIDLFNFVSEEQGFMLIQEKESYNLFKINFKLKDSYNKNDYNRTYINNMLKIIECYQKELYKNGNSIEKILEYMYKEHININYNIDLIEKCKKGIMCRNMLPFIEGILRKYQEIEGYYEIDLKNIKSKNENKYIYPTENFKKIFSSEDYYDENFINFLENNLNNNDNKIRYVFRNFSENDLEIEKVKKIFYYLYKYGVFNSSKYAKEYEKIIDKFKKLNLIEFESNLFTRQEASLFNYILNNQDFENNMAIRNLILHGYEISDEKMSEYYKYIILIMIILTIKINDETK